MSDLPSGSSVGDHLPQGTAFLGLLVGAAAAVTLVLRGRPILEGLGASSLLGLTVAGTGAVVGALAVLRARPRWAVASSGLLLLAPAPYRLGLPSLVDWGIALAGVLGIAVLLQAMLVAREGASLHQRLTVRDEAGAPGRDVSGLVTRTVDHRLERSRRTLLLAAGTVVGGIVLSRVVGVVLPAGVADSLELRSLYGTVLMVLLLLGGLLVVAGVRRIRRDDGDPGAP